MSSRSDVLGILWSRETIVIPDSEAALVRAPLSTLFPGRTILIGVEDGEFAERVLLDDTEVMPALSLGDVVAEELNISVPYGTVIAFVPVSVFAQGASPEDRGVVIGRVYAQILVEALHRGGFPMDRETGLVLGLAESAVAAVAQLQADLIHRDAFEQALAATLCSVLFGDRQSEDPAVCLKDLKDRYGAGAQANVVQAAGEGAPLNFEEWLSSVATGAVREGGAIEVAEEVRQLRESKI